MQNQSACDEFEVAKETLDVARVIEFQNVTFDSQGVPSLSKEVAKDRRISIEDLDQICGMEGKAGLRRQGKHILTGTQNMLQLNPTKFPCSWL